MTGFDSKRQAAQAKMDDDTQVYADTLLIVYQRGFADGKKAANAMHDLARLGQEIEQGQAEPCVGKDPRCPCQDGDACHYKDCDGGTKARPVAQPEQGPVALVIDGVLVKSELPEKYTGHLYTTPPAAQRQWVGLTDEEIWSAVSRIGTSDSNVNPLVVLNDARAIEAKLKERNT